MRATTLRCQINVHPPCLLIFQYFPTPPELNRTPLFINFSSLIMNHRSKQKQKMFGEHFALACVQFWCKISCQKSHSTLPQHTCTVFQFISLKFPPTVYFDPPFIKISFRNSPPPAPIYFDPRLFIWHLRVCFRIYLFHSY